VTPNPVGEAPIRAPNPRACEAGVTYTGRIAAGCSTGRVLPAGAGAAADNAGSDARAGAMAEARVASCAPRCAIEPQLTCT